MNVDELKHRFIENYCNMKKHLNTQYIPCEEIQQLLQCPGPLQPFQPGAGKVG